MVMVSYPGVYVREVPSGVRTITGVSTSIAMFIGRTGQGTLETPVRCLNYTTFKDTFSEDVTVGDMVRYVRLFFQNGGTDCYVMRIANGAEAAEVTLENEHGVSVLRLMAKEVGIAGETIRAEVSYKGPQPEATFSIRLFRWDEDHRGNSVQEDLEEWINLSMDPNSTNYAVDVLNQQSRLVNAEDVGGTEINGYSLSGRPIEYVIGADDSTTAGNFLAACELLVTDDQFRFEISVDGSGYAPVDMSGLTMPASYTDVDDAASQLAEQIQNAIHSGLRLQGAASTTVSVSFDVGPVPATGSASRLLRVLSENNGNVFIRAVVEDDLAVPLMLGTAQGGLEVGSNALRRPAPNGISFVLIDSEDGEPLLPVLAAQPQSELVEISIVDSGGTARLHCGSSNHCLW